MAGERRFKVGVQLQPQHTTVDELRRAWKEADAMEVDLVTTWDHFYPLYGDTSGAHFEGWTLLSAMAADTSHAMISLLVTCNSYRNPDLLADMARTVDHISHGRAVLGIGSGWYEKDYEEYGFDFGTAGSRLRDLESSLKRIKTRLAKLNPPPVGKLPIMIGGGGEQVTLRLVAEYADWWNGFADAFAQKTRVLDEWCAKVGRNPRDIVRTVSVRPERVESAPTLVEQGADLVIVNMGFERPGGRFNLDPVRRLLEIAEGAHATA